MNAEDIKKKLNLTSLRGASLHGADLSGADLSGADLSGADLSCANLHGASLRFASLRFANLSCATLRDADLRFADLSGADLSGADLYDANLIGRKPIFADSERHYVMYVIPDAKGGPRFIAGCRNFSYEEAINHWKEKQPGYVSAIEEWKASR